MHAAEIRYSFEAKFHAAEDRFECWKSLINRFTYAVDKVLSHGLDFFAAVDEAQNELCIASEILASVDAHIVQLEYEPTLPGCAKSIDFRAVAADGAVFYVDVKTIMPSLKDRWEQFERAQKEQWFAKNADVILDKTGLGGELWHLMFTARGRMLEHSIELETKISEANLRAENTHFVMAFCGEGFHWSYDELEDFVSFYFSGRHRADDLFSQAELKYIAEKKLRLNRTITKFACMSRPQRALRQTQIDWDVQAH